MIALVTGAGKGIGLAIADDLANHGYTVIRHTRATADFLKPDQVQAFFADIHKQYGLLDAVVHTIGDLGAYQPVEALTVADYEAVWDSNVATAALCFEHAVPLLVHSTQGRIVTFACADAQFATSRKFSAAYYMAKQAVITLTKSWAVALADKHITANCIAPGVVETSVISQAMPMGRPASVTDIANATRFILSSEANYISGTVLEVAGAWRPGI